MGITDAMPDVSPMRTPSAGEAGQFRVVQSKNMPESAIAPAATSDSSVAGLLTRCQAAHDNGEHLQGVELAEQALSLTHDSTAPTEIAQAYSLLAGHRWRLGQFELAVMAAREAVKRWAPLGGRQECDTLCLLAISYSELGLHEEALKCATAAFDKSRDQKFDAQTVQALNRIGVCFDRLGDPAQSEKFLLQSLGQARELNDHNQVLGALNNLMATAISAFYHYRQRDEHELSAGALQRARQYGRQSVSLARRHADAYRLAVTQGNLGEVLGLAGEYAESHRVLEETVQQARAHGYRAVELRSRHNIGEVLIQEGRYEEAVALLDATLHELESADQETTRMRVHSALYRAHKAARRFEPALHHCESYHALELQRAALQSHAQARLMVNRIDVEKALMDGERARLEAELQRLRSKELEDEKRQLEARTAELQRDTLEDQLTRLANRRRVDEDLPRILARALESNAPLCVAVADLDHFKQVNDRFGHAVGDAVLRSAAQIFRVKTRTRDLVARIGGEEFLFVFVDTSPQIARDVCERLRSAVEAHPWEQAAAGLRVTMSIGLADMRLSDTPAELIARADAALYEAKHAGRNQLRET
jgi:diguanylate cyclase (GGDEF)-like protein